ncbi:hypothetical protein LCGC14_2985750, partial [marine sediment metagenome]
QNNISYKGKKDLIEILLLQKILILKKLFYFL